MKKIDVGGDTVTNETRAAAGPGTERDEIVGAMGTPTLQLIRELIDTAQRSRPAVARRAELSHTELAALELLARRSHGPGELARHLGVTAAAASGIVDRLAERGHAVRQRDDDDRRRTQVSITESGHQDVLSHLLPMFAELDRLDRGLSEDERAVVERYLAGVVEAIRRLL